MYESNKTKTTTPASIGDDLTTIPVHSRDVLSELLHDGAQRLLGHAIEAEVADWIEQHAGLKGDQGRRQVVRNGHHPARTLVTGVGAVAVTQPRVLDPRQADRVVAGPNSEINSPIAVAIDGPNDVLFVSENFAQNTIYVFDNVSQAAFDGDPHPDRIISTDDTSFDPEQMAFYAGDLYVVSRDNILVYADASTLDTVAAVPDRIISGPLLDDPIISIDSRGRLVVANQNDTILIWNSAADVDGSPAPDLMLTINGAGRLEAAVIDSDDRLYAAERNDAVIYSLDSISVLSSGSVNADRIIESSALLMPDRLFLFEP